MAIPEPFLVIGAAGAQGGAVLAALRRRGLPARALVRAGREADALRKNGVNDIVTADLTDPAALAGAARETAGVFLVTSFEADVDQAQRTAERVVQGLKDGGAQHVVFNTGLIAGMPRVGVGSVDGKLATLDGLRAAGAPVVELAVTYYLENWLMPWASGRLGSGVLGYPLPADMPVSWLAHADMGEAAAAALTRPDLAGRTVQLGGPAMTPVEMTAAIGRAVGRDLRFEQVPLDAIIAGGDAASGPARIGTAIGALYRWALSEAGPLPAVGTDGLAELGVTPMAPERWAEAQAWAAAAPPPAAPTAGR